MSQGPPSWLATSGAPELRADRANTRLEPWDGSAENGLIDWCACGKLARFIARRGTAGQTREDDDFY
jgi:hypothetical protein